MNKNLILVSNQKLGWVVDKDYLSSLCGGHIGFWTFALERLYLHQICGYSRYYNQPNRPRNITSNLISDELLVDSSRFFEDCRLRVDLTSMTPSQSDLLVRIPPTSGQPIDIFLYKKFSF